MRLRKCPFYHVLTWNYKRAGIACELISYQTNNFLSYTVLFHWSLETQKSLWNFLHNSLSKPSPTINTLVKSCSTIMIVLWPFRISEYFVTYSLIINNKFMTHFGIIIIWENFLNRYNYKLRKSSLKLNVYISKIYLHFSGN